MDLFESKEKLKKMNNYLSLNARLEEIVEDDLLEILTITRNCLENDVNFYKKFVSSKEELLRLRAEADGNQAKLIQKISERNDMDYDKAKRWLDAEDQKSYKVIRKECISGVLKKITLAIVMRPFSKKKSSDYISMVKNYFTSLRAIKKIEKLKKINNKREQENLRKDIERDQKQGAFSLRLQTEGFDEKIADAISLEPVLFTYNVLDNLKNKYGLD